MDNKILIKLSALTFAGSFIFTVISYLVDPLFLRGILEILENTAFMLICWNTIAIASYISQQKPKEDKALERRLLKKILLLAFFTSLGIIIFVIFASLGAWKNLFSAILTVSFSLSLLIIYPVILNQYKKHCKIIGDKVKETLTNKCMITFFVLLALSLFWNYLKAHR